MSRLIALFNRDGAPANEVLLRALTAPLSDPRRSDPRCVIDGSAGIAVQSITSSARPEGEQPAAIGATLWIAFDGRLDNRHELASGLDFAETSSDAGDAALALASYRRYGVAFASKLVGDFALAVFDRERRTLLLARDPIGVRPLYVWCTPRLVVAASEAKCILAHPEVTPRPDHDAIADLLAGGNPDERRLTLFKDIHRVLPGETVVITPNERTSLNHWDFDPSRQIRLRSSAEYAECLRAHFQTAVRRRLRTTGPVGVAVSGGLDSSAILCQATSLRRIDSALPPIQGITSLYPEGSAADEREYVSDIEQEWGIHVHRLPATPIRLSHEARWPWHTEAPSLASNRHLEILETARSLSCTTLLDGYYGDQVLWSYSHLFDPLRKLRIRAAWDEMRELAATLGYPSAAALAGEVIPDFARDVAPDDFMRPYRFLRNLRRSRDSWWASAVRRRAYRRSQDQRRPDGRFATKHAELCYRSVRRSHLLNTFENWNKLAAAHGIEKAYPFADRDLIAYVMAIPGEVLTPGGIYKGLFREAMRGLLPARILNRHNKADFTELDVNAAAELDAGSMARLFGADSLALSLGFLDRERLGPALAGNHSRLTSDDFLPAKARADLFAFELLLRSFFGERNPGQMD